MRESVVGVCKISDTDWKWWQATTGTELLRQDARLDIIGSGFIVEEGLVYTADHIVDEWHEALKEWGAQKVPREWHLAILVIAPDPTAIPGVEFRPRYNLLRVDEIIRGREEDAALLFVNEIPNWFPWKPGKFSDEAVEEGDEVAVCGFPEEELLHDDIIAFGRKNSVVISPSFTSAIISAILPFPWLPDELRGYLQIDAITNFGNSGGPVFDTETGDIVGMVIESHCEFSYPITIPRNLFQHDNTDFELMDEISNDINKGGKYDIAVDRIDTPWGFSRALPSGFLKITLDQARGILPTIRQAIAKRIESRRESSTE